MSMQMTTNPVVIAMFLQNQELTELNIRLNASCDEGLKQDPSLPQNGRRYWA
jgi:hypothetical protein